MERPTSSVSSCTGSAARGALKHFPPFLMNLSHHLEQLTDVPDSHQDHALFHFENTMSYRATFAPAARPPHGADAHAVGLPRPRGPHGRVWDPRVTHVARFGPDVPCGPGALRRLKWELWVLTPPTRPDAWSSWLATAPWTLWGHTRVRGWRVEAAEAVGLASQKRKFSFSEICRPFWVLPHIEFMKIPRARE